MDALEIIMIPFIIIIIVISQIKKYVDERKNKKIEILSSIDNFCDKNYKTILLIFLGIILISTIYKFGEFPESIHVDEAGMAYDAYCIANYGVDRYLNSYPVYLQNFGGGQSVLACYIAALFVKIIGANMIAYRLPALIIYILGIIASYFLVVKNKDKKTALLFTFLIITCPWNIVNARWTLDCNLYAGMFMISLFFMNNAKKNYQYILAGIFLGITLYTYCLSWITLPIFLIVWSIYILYLKKINIKQLILIGIPVLILAMPLIYFLLLNYGIVSQTKIGLVTIPKLIEFRVGEITISNIVKNGLESIQVIFLYKETIYLPYILLFIIGYVKSFIVTVKKIKEKQYTITTVMFIAFTTLLIGLLVTKIPTPNKANVLYILILYFVAIAIFEICKNSKVLFIAILVLITIMFAKFEYKYYTNKDINLNNYWYEDKSLTKITKVLEEDEKTKDLEKYIIVFKTDSYIYPTLQNKESPYKFSSTFNIENYMGVAQIEEYHYYNYFVNGSQIKDVDFENNNYIVIVSEYYQNVIEYIESKGYEKEKFEDLYILRNKKYKKSWDFPTFYVCLAYISNIHNHCCYYHSNNKLKLKQL